MKSGKNGFAVFRLAGFLVEVRGVEPRSESLVHKRLHAYLMSNLGGSNTLKNSATYPAVCADMVTAGAYHIRSSPK